MLQSEFIAKYTKGDLLLEDKFNESWKFCMPCDCDYENCPWWAMISFISLLDHMETSMGKWQKDIYH